MRPLTPALKAMVEAMRAEIVRQSKEGYEEPWVAAPSGVDGAFISVDGNVDLEGVARAGLEAIRLPAAHVSEPAYDAFDWGPSGYDNAPNGSAAPETVFAYMIDAILKDQP